MADNPTLEIENATPAAAPVKRKGVKRRAFLVGSFAVAGAGYFGLRWADAANTAKAKALTASEGAGNFAGWLRIAPDDTITLFSPHTDLGQGSHTALAQMMADELDADWAKVRTEQAPAERPFANMALGKGFLLGTTQIPTMLTGTVDAVIGRIARSMNLQITGGSTAIRLTGQYGMRMIGASAREALVNTAAARLGVPASELTTQDSKVIHAKSGKSLRYGALAEEAAGLTLNKAPALKARKDYKIIGKSVARADIPAKVNGSAKYGIDFTLPEMRVATIMAAPARGGTLSAVDPAPAMAVKGVEKVIKLDNAVAVVAKGYWPALTGLRTLSPKFTDGGHGALSSASLFAAQDSLRKAGKPTNEVSEGDLAAAFAATGTKRVEADFRLPFLHQAPIEPLCLTAHFKDGKLDIWGGMQDPLGCKMKAVEESGLSADDVTFHAMMMGGSFGRKISQYGQVLGQVVKLAMQLPYPVKLIWSREEEVKQGAYRPQASAQLKGAVGPDGKITAWQTDYVQFPSFEGETVFPYQVPAFSRRHFEHISNQVDAYWRSVNSTQTGFYYETFMDELAAAAGVDPYQFRRTHLKAGSRHLAVLDSVAKRSGWGTPLPAGTGRGIAIVESFGTIVAHVVEASVKADGMPKIHKVYAVADCGTTVSPVNGEAQVQGGIIMGLSAAVGEEITLDKGAVVQSNFSDYALMQLADAPPIIDVHFIESDAPVGGLGEPGLPPAAPALANALYAATGKRVRTLPIRAQAMRTGAIKTEPKA
jgi:isoquinoline 1-oxidoreductase subunit beta